MHARLYIIDQVSCHDTPACKPTVAKPARCKCTYCRQRCLVTCLAAVFEPKYLSLFRDLQSLTAPGSEPKFGHILAASSAPPALMQDSVGGLPNMGVCAAVKSVQQLDNGRLLVSAQLCKSELGSWVYSESAQQVSTLTCVFFAANPAMLQCSHSLHLKFGNKVWE